MFLGVADSDWNEGRWRWNCADGVSGDALARLAARLIAKVQERLVFEW
jgi:hypothetical protein